MRILFLISALILLGSCSPYDASSGDILIVPEVSKYIVVDAPAVSCKSARSTAPTEDIQALSVNLGRFSLSWRPPEGSTTAALKLIYIQIRMRSSGILDSENPITITGQDLACILHGVVDGGSTLSISQGGTPDADGVIIPHQFAAELLIGNFAPAKDKKSSFSGTGQVLVYGLIKEPGQQDKPVIGRTSFQFSFGAIPF